MILQVQSLNLEIILHPKLITATLAGAKCIQNICKLLSKAACERVAGMDMQRTQVGMDQLITG